MKNRTIEEILNDFQTYLWKKIEEASIYNERAEEKEMWLYILAYLFEVRSLFKEMVFLGTNLTKMEVDHYRLTSEIYRIKYWTSGIDRVANELSVYWDELLQIASKNEKENSND